MMNIHPKEMKTGYQRDTCTPMFTAALLTNSQDMETTEYPSMDE